MSKCKRNILLIFGFLLIVNLLFIPCNKTHYSFSLTNLLPVNVEKARWESTFYTKVFFPLVISRRSKYKKYVEWESKAFLLFAEKIKARTELEKELNETNETHEEYMQRFFMDDKTYQKLKNEKVLSQKAKLSMKYYEINKDIKETYNKKINEKTEKFGYPKVYHQFYTNFFFGEFVLLILVGSLVYIHFCIVLKKTREKKREAERDVLKKRKIGVILTLIGIGIIFIFSQFNKGGEVDIEIGNLSLEFPYGYPFAIGIILVLIGAGKIVFSFFPKEEK